MVSYLIQTDISGLHLNCP